jgi:hypothetical protein
MPRLAALALFRTEHDRARAVAEQHAGGAVFPVENAAEGFRSDHQRVFAAPERIIESATLTA